jgi:hypothetical protein
LEKGWTRARETQNKVDPETGTPRTRETRKMETQKMEAQRKGKSTRDQVCGRGRPRTQETFKK